jgi:hypothetical protein
METHDSLWRLLPLAVMVAIAAGRELIVNWRAKRAAKRAALSDVGSAYRPTADGRVSRAPRRVTSSSAPRFLK